jgi:hypothetical protein
VEAGGLESPPWARRVATQYVHYVYMLLVYVVYVYYPRPGGFAPPEACCPCLERTALLLF